MFPRCPECGGEVKLLAKEGMKREIDKAFFLPVPADFKIPTCINCGEELITLEIAGELDKILRRNAFLEVCRYFDLK